MSRLLGIIIVLLSTLEVSSQGFPFIRNYLAEDYQGSNINFDITTDEEGRIYVANFEGVMYYDHAEWKILHTPGITRVTVIFTASDNTIWAGGYNFFGKIVHQSNGSPTLKRIGDADLFSGEVKEIYEYGGKLKFVVSNGNIYELQGDKVAVKSKIDEKFLRIGMLDVLNVNALESGAGYVSVEDTLFSESLNSELDVVALKNSGIVVKDKKNNKQYVISDNNGLCSNDLAYVTYDGRGQIWGATGKGVFAIQIPSSYTQFTHFQGLIGQVLSIEKFNGNIYVGTDDGLFRQEGIGFVRMPGIRHACWSMKTNEQGLFAATAEGVFKISPSGNISQLTDVTSMALFIDGSIIYSGELNGLYTIQTDGKARKKVSALENVRKILQDQEGTIWMQNLYGSVWYKRAGETAFRLYSKGKKAEVMSTIVLVNGKVEVISAEDSKPFPYPLVSYADAHGVTWLTDNEGKNLYRWKDGKRQKDYDTFLFPVSDITISTIFVDDHQVWLGDDNGVTLINTQIKDPLLDISPTLAIRSITLQSDSILWGGFGQMPESLPMLSHENNNLHFTFSLDYTPIVGKNLYRYRMNEGKWSAWSSRTQATFQNLTYGDYTFSVQAQDFCGRMTDVTSISFHIKAPFYYRWYMIVLYSVLLLIILYLLVKFRLHRLEKDKLLLEKTVQARTAEVVKQKDEIEEKSKSLETALKDLGEAQHELIRQEKMATLGKLTQGLIDRILNPLNYINNFAKLSEGLVKDAKANIEDEKDNMEEENYEDTLDVLDMLTGNLQKVGEHGQNTTRILKAMEELLKDRSGGIVETDLSSIFKQNKEMVEKYYAKEIKENHINFHIDIPDQEILLHANPELLSKIFMNFLGNSIYAIVKKARQAKFEPELFVKANTSEDTVTITFHDNGIGIEETIINKIFDPFFTTKTTGEASGIGLYLCHEVVQNYSGNISVSSVKGEYCEFIVSLPTIKK